MAAKTQEQILAAAGRPGWRVIGTKPEMKSVSVRDANNNVQTTEQPTGNTIWIVAPPPGMAGVQAGQSDPIVVRETTPANPSSGQAGDQLPTSALYELVTAPGQAPQQTPAGSSGVVSAPPSEQYLLTRNPDGTLSSVLNPNYHAPQGPAPQTATTAQGLWERQPDGSFKLILPADKAPHVVGGTASSDQFLIVEDSTGNRQQIPNPNYRAPRPSVIGGTNTTDQYLITQNPDGTTSQSPNPNYVAPRPVLATGGATGDQYIVTMAPDGTFTNTPNPNYQGAKPSIEPGYQNADKIPMIVKDPDGKWTVEWVPNNGRPMTSVAALKDLADTMSLHLGDGPNQIPVQTAKDLFSIANDVYTAQTARQTANNQGAQVGAGLLQNRATNVAGQENSLLSLAGSKTFGLGGPLPAGLWSGVHNEVMGNMTQAGGGQSVYDTAIALVQRANPNLPPQQSTQAAAQLATMLQGHEQATGQPAPQVATVAPAAPTAFAQSGIPEGSNRGFQPPVIDPASVVHAAVSAALQPGQYAQSGIAEGSSRGFQAPRVM